MSNMSKKLYLIDYDNNTKIYRYCYSESQARYLGIVYAKKNNIKFLKLTVKAMEDKMSKIETFTMYQVYFDNGYTTLLSEEEFSYLKDEDYIKADKIDNCYYDNGNLYIVKLNKNGTKIVEKKLYERYNSIKSLYEESASLGLIKS